MKGFLFRNLRPSVRSAGQFLWVALRGVKPLPRNQGPIRCGLPADHGDEVFAFFVGEIAIRIEVAARGSGVALGPGLHERGES